MNPAKLKTAALDFLFPPNARCAVCGRTLLFEENSVCKSCFHKISFLHEPRCAQCKRGVGEGEALQFSFECAISLFAYEGAGEDVIADLKFRGNPGAAKPWGEMLAELVRKQPWAAGLDMAACVPSDEKKRKERGYNQAELLSDVISVKCGIINRKELLAKREGALDQIGLGARERFENAKSAYYAADTRGIAGKTILLVDDVLTSGATAEACASVLKEAGAGRVYVATLASTLHS